MQKTIYEDGKYTLQDVGNLYVGTKYTLEEILNEESITFKFRLVVERYMLPEADLQDTLETHLYYLDAKSFLVKIYKQLKARVKMNVIEEKKSVGGGSRRVYTTKTVTVEELSAMSVAEKEQKGVVVQELMVSKLALMAF
ncbi:MAG: hypothetical protein IJ833_07975 [Lachnospiraceae bacterium]|nr:hypothetical protein [Lachnospiraceae bacterium]